MKTSLVRVDPSNPDLETIERAAHLLRNGGLVAFPTETVYGLGADALNDAAVERVFEAKGRPSDNPMIVHVSSREMAGVVSESIGEDSARLMERFWPGPLTLVLMRRTGVAERAAAGLPTVAVRMPESRIALELIRLADTPVAAPSANLSGRPSPTRAEHVMRDLDGRIEMVLDGGETRIGIESTVLDMTGDPPAVLRPGWISREMLEREIGRVASAASVEELSRSPGTRHTHYSPRAAVILVEGRDPAFIERLCRDLLARGRLGFVGHTRIQIDDERFRPVMLGDAPADYARAIYGALRELDDVADTIVVEGIQDRGEGEAVMDRLRRSASEIIA